MEVKGPYNEKRIQRKLGREFLSRFTREVLSIKIVESKKKKKVKGN